MDSPIKPSSSNPDLSAQKKDKPVESDINKWKRKVQEMESDTMDNLLSAYTKTMEASLARLKSKIDSSIGEIHKTLNVVMKDKLDELSVTTNSIRDDINTLRSDYTEIKQSVSAMHRQQAETAAVISDITATIDFTSERVDTLQKRVDDSQSAIREHESELSELKKNFQAFKLDVNKQQQRDRKLNIEIVGLPEFTSKTENLQDVVINIAKFAGVTLTYSDIEHVNRVQPKKSYQGRPRVVVAKLRTRINKDNIIAGIRKNRGVTTKDINIPGDTRQLFVNEHLTVSNKALLKKCKEIAASKMYQYVWVKNCRIFVRHSDNSHAIAIDCEEDLQKIR